MHIQLDYSSQDLIDCDEVARVGLDCRPGYEALIVYWKKGGTTYFESTATNDVSRGYGEISDRLLPLKKPIQVDQTLGGLVIDALEVSSVRVDTICGLTTLHIRMKSGEEHRRGHRPGIGMDVFDLHRLIVEAM